MRRGASHHAIGLEAVKRAQRSASGADNEHPDAFGMRPAIRILRREALIAVIVAVDYDVRPGLVEGLGQGPGAGVSSCWPELKSEWYQQASVQAL